MLKGFMKLDETMQKFRGDEDKSGTTATCALLTPEYIFFANLGFILYSITTLLKALKFFF